MRTLFLIILVSIVVILVDFGIGGVIHVYSRLKSHAQVELPLSKCRPDGTCAFNTADTPISQSADKTP